MKITATKVKKILHDNYGWINLNNGENQIMKHQLITDTISVINDILKAQKSITIKKVER